MSATRQETEQFHSAVAALHQAVDTWAETIVGVGAEAADPEDALSDPRLEAVEDDFNRVLGVFHGAAGPLLGLPLLVDLTEGVDSDEDFDDDSVLSLQFWVVAPERDRDAYLSSALRIVDDAGRDVVRRLEEAGFTVASYASGLDEEDFDDEDDL